MTENKWVVDGHHYTCPVCKKTMAVVISESDEGFKFCPFCGKRMSGQMAENKTEQVAALFGKRLFREFFVKLPKETRRARFTNYGLEVFDGCIFLENGDILNKLIVGKADIVDGRE